MASYISGKENCIEFLTVQSWTKETINERIEEFLKDNFDQIAFDKNGNFYFRKTDPIKKLFTCDGYKIWAHSLEEAKSHLEIIKKF